MFLSYFRLGVEHIVPLVTDHALFVAVLFLSAASLTALAWQVSAFTVAHALTLALVATGAVEARALEGRVVLVVGAHGGLGDAASRACAQAGAKLVLDCRQSLIANS